MAKAIVPLLPDHTYYIEPFFGAGGMFFNKPKAPHNILNDLDGEVFNVFDIAVRDPRGLERLWTATPIHGDLWREWQTSIPEEPVARAVRFLMLSNLGFMGNHSTLRLATGNAKRIMLERLVETRRMLWDCEFTNLDWKVMLQRIPRSVLGRRSTLVYADPPYLDTSSDDYVAGFKIEDSMDLIDTLHLCGASFAMSEFDHPAILDKAASLGLTIHNLGERKNLLNRRTEILITNARP